MKKLIIAIVASLTVSGCASQASLDAADAKIKTLEENVVALSSRTKELESQRLAAKAKDDAQFCFVNDLAYSEGSIHEGRICQRIATSNVFGRDDNPLRWTPWEYSQSRTVKGM